MSGLRVSTREDHLHFSSRSPQFRHNLRDWVKNAESINSLDVWLPFLNGGGGRRNTGAKLQTKGKPVVRRGRKAKDLSRDRLVTKELVVRRQLTIIAMLLLVAVFWPVHATSSAVALAATASDQPSFSDDPINGKIVVETSTMKGVWNYRTSPSESNNQSGGNLFELYHKASDPGYARNLISYVSLPNWGTGRDLTMPGVGGLGATAIYASTVKPPSSGNISPIADDQVSDNNLEGDLQSHSVNLDSSGNAVIRFSYKVKSLSGNAALQAPNNYWYQVDKEWIVEPAGTIHFKVDWTILSSGYFSEPATRFNWNASPDVGWNRSVKNGRTWGNEANPLRNIGIDGMQNVTVCCWDDLNMFWTESISLTGSSVAPTMTMTAENNGQGYLGSGSHKLNMSMGNMGDNEELCNVRTSIADSYGIGWYAWWGGYWPNGERYFPLAANTNWTDSWRIDMSDAPILVAPEVSSVNTQLNSVGHARITWDTVMDANSVVEFQIGGVWTTKAWDTNLSQSHALDVTGLSSGASYTYRVKSVDRSGNTTVSNARELIMPDTTQISLSLSQLATYWSSYNDYTSRLLSVDFLVSNAGASVARSVNIVSMVNSNGITSGSTLPITLGDAPAGSSSRFTAKYSIPEGVAGFRTLLYSTCIGANGELLSFP